jgi:S-DNA-T family DNA segregation ATPase FtsK/SpoIIIE
VNIAVDQATETAPVLVTLGPKGIVVLLAVGTLVLTWKSKTIRRAEWKAFRWACRLTWRLLLALVRLPWRAGRFRATREERRILARLAPSHWRSHREARGLDGTITSRPKLTASGIVVNVRLDGAWTTAHLRKAEDNIRALLGCRTDLRIEIKAGKRGGWAEMTLRTRSAAEGVSLDGWKPGDPWGIDTVTGDLVSVPLGRRMLIAGTSGAGKSWSTRALLAEASETPDHRLVVIDPKRVEALNWQHRARTAVHPDEVLDVSSELVAEMHDRLKLIPRGRDVIEISQERPRITVFVDEGAEVISMSREKGYDRIMENFRTLARMARAAEIILIWATQKPTMDRNGGIDPQISAQITYRAALALSTSGESRVVFGEDATEKGWHAHELPMPGFALLRSGPKVKPHPIKTRAFSPKDVIALPDRPVWSRAETAGTVGGRSADRPVRLVKESAPTAEDRVLDAVLRAGHPIRQKDIAQASGLSKGAVSKAVARLVATGRLAKQEDGTVRRTEVAA